jgi:predicted acylesterase/phospholipase RssA
MLSMHAARHRHAHHVPPRIGLAIAGGGPMGGMYELGALRALDDAIDGLDLSRLDVYVGVSSGAFLAASLVNRIGTAEMCRAFISGDSDDIHFHPEDFVRPAFGEYLRRAGALPQVLGDWASDLLRGRTTGRWSDALTRLGSLVPTGLFDNRGIERFMRDLLERRGRSNHFEDFIGRLYLVAVDLDSGEAVRFGEPGWRHVPISRAVQASSALPGLYPPVKIEGRSYVDGVLRRTMHASIALEHDIDLLLGVNPLVPYDGGRHAVVDSPLMRGGLPAVLSQTLRTMLQSRVEIGLEKYTRQFPDVDQMVFEPDAGDSEFFFTNLFSFSARRRVLELAYRNTIADLRHNAERAGAVLAAHGMRLDPARLDPSRSIMDGLGPVSRRTDTTARLDRALDDAGELLGELQRSARRRRARRVV